MANKPTVRGPSLSSVLWPPSWPGQRWSSNCRLIRHSTTRGGC